MTWIRRWTLVSTALFAAAALAGCDARRAGRAPGDGVPAAAGFAARDEGASAYASADRDLQAMMREGSAWPSYGRDYTNQRFSPLAQINTGNVARLTKVWSYHTGIREAHEVSPVVMNGVMYVSTPMDHVIALDARTGGRLWEYAHPLGRTIMCCGPVNRGVAVYDGKVYLATLDAELVALDARTGRKVWETKVADNMRGYSMTLAPVAVRGKVLVGVSGAEYGIRGHVSAYDARTGGRVWRWNTIPGPDEGGWWGKWAETDPFGHRLNRDIAQEKRDSARFADAWKTGGGSVWQSPAIDLERGLILWTVNNASPDVDGRVRPGDNLYTNCIVALELETGKLRWYFQEVPHDTWDYDPISPVVLMDVRDSAGAVVPAVAQAGKTGWVYVLDRRDGRPIRLSEPFVPHNNMFSPATREGTFVQPGGNGGSEWSPTAYSPQTGYMYVLGLNEHDLYKLRPEKLDPPASWLSGVWYTVDAKRDNGTFTAVDLNTGRIAWQQVVPDPMVGGALATAGGLVFVGTKDKRLLAYDARSGRQLWVHAANAGVNAPPVSYAIDGRQYIAVAAGGNLQINAPRGDEIVVFALGPAAGAPVPAPPPTPERPLPPGRTPPPAPRGGR
ncbi:MAG TPA: PQQ-binding-like beta-propeller repeat protein [Longimicrobium sp.]|nr:PQQ-binding-like beta-propeller repeat protein [Longimicrobium sp.]